MMESLISHSRSLGALKLSLAVSAPNAPAIKLYERLGFKTEGVLKYDFRYSQGAQTGDRLVGDRLGSRRMEWYF